MIPSNDIGKADDLLETWDDACNELNVPHMLIYGTALGFYRDGGYITGDNDIDTRVICNKEKWKELIKRLKGKGIIQTSHPGGWGFHKHGIHMAIERSEKVGIIIWDNGWEFKIQPLYHKFDTIEYKGRKYNVPHPVEKYLENRYGKDWRIPNLKWDKKSAAPPRIK